jgi:hypothetical protein
MKLCFVHQRAIPVGVNERVPDEPVQRCSIALNLCLIPGILERDQLAALSFLVRDGSLRHCDHGGCQEDGR